MNANQPNSPSLKEQLVAYLDGELDEASTRELEHLLSTDPAAREALHKLESAWDMLDALPRAEVDESFTHTTIEMLAVSVEKDIRDERSARPGRELRKWGLGAAALAAACVLGFFVVTSLSVDPNEQLLKDLPLLERLDQYRQVDEVQFLRDLHAANVLKEIHSQSEEPTSLADRRMQIEAMTPAEKETLQDRQKRFTELPMSEQDRLRQLHESVQKDPQASQLRGTMAAYYEWLLKLSPSQRASLAAADTATRVGRVTSLRRDEIQREADRPDTVDLDNIAAWLEEQIRPALQKDRLAAIDRLPEEDRRGALMLLILTRTPGAPGKVPEMTPEIVASLMKHLSEGGKAKLAALPDDAQRVKKLGDWNGWVWQAVRHTMRQYFDSILADVPEEELVEYSKQLPEKQREELMKLPPEYRDHRLRVSFVMQHRSERLPEFSRNLKPENMLFLRGFRGDGRWPGPGRGSSPGQPFSPQRRPERPTSER